MAKGNHREKAKALIIAMKAKPAADAAAEDAMHGTKPPEVQCMKAFIEAVKDGDAEEALSCLGSLFRHFEGQPHDEAGDEGESSEAV